ncbi:MAG: hypothetical protein ACT4QB_02590 [Gammaproteobacteria bacterium]
MDGMDHTRATQEMVYPRAMEAMLQMKKIDIAAVERAADGG